ncbi:hypothetical protein AAFF_G00232900 [Aldrovandia affinis]|uniref:Uncharacterized protein n=1 Tax=Aldrovandia affinis TaxID=143900 RepID=A0AAD7RF28_9TELE|nr:hypothetical protein AAFF_G00232900 [Aldrovandia affinis]
MDGVSTSRQIRKGQLPGDVCGRRGPGYVAALEPIVPKVPEAAGAIAPTRAGGGPVFDSIFLPAFPPLRFSSARALGSHRLAADRPAPRYFLRTGDFLWRIRSLIRRE